MRGENGGIFLGFIETWMDIDVGGGVPGQVGNADGLDSDGHCFSCCFSITRWFLKSWLEVRAEKY